MTENEKVLDFVNRAIETELVDFKQVFYKNIKNSDIAKDVAAFANNSLNEDKYIIFGVSDKAKEICGIDIKTIPDIATIENFLETKIEPFISVSIGKIRVEEKDIAYLKISKDNFNRPYVMKNNSGNDKIETGDIFIRKGTCNLKATRSDINLMYENNKEKKIRIFDDVISISPISMPKELIKNPTYGILCIEIINHSNKPFLLKDGFIILRNEYGQIERRIYDILPATNIREKPFEVPANSRFKKTALFNFLSEDCITLRFEDDGMLHYDTYAKTIFIDTDDNEYYSDEIKVLYIKASGVILHKIKRLYSNFRTYLKKNEKQLINAITSHKNEELEELLNMKIIDFSFIQPGYVLGNPIFPEYDILAKMVRAAISSNNTKALIQFKNLGLKEDFIEFAKI